MPSKEKEENKIIMSLLKHKRMSRRRETESYERKVNHRTDQMYGFQFYYFVFFSLLVYISVEIKLNSSILIKS